MKTKKNSKLAEIMALALMLPSAAFAQASGSHGGGEDGVFKGIRDEVSSWINKNAEINALESKLELSGMSGLALKARFDQAVNAVGEKVIFTKEEIRFGNNYRICKNENQTITCNADAWNATSGNSRYLIVFHEYLGVAGIETNIEKDYSRYPVSSKIMSFVKTKEAFELGMEKNGSMPTYDESKDENFLFSCVDKRNGIFYDGRISDGQIKVEMSDNHSIIELKNKKIFSKKNLFYKVLGDESDEGAVYVMKLKNGDKDVLVAKKSMVRLEIPVALPYLYGQNRYTQEVAASHSFHPFKILKIKSPMSCDVNYANMKKSLKKN